MDSTTATTARNLRRRARHSGRTVREQAHVEALRMMTTHRPAAVVSHLALALTAERAA